MNKIELLAPAGSMEAFRAAVENGADAIYIGGNKFSARQYANNFAGQELKEAVDYAHSRGVKIYVAVNTLIANEEIEALVDYLYELADSQIDAIIVQDLGVASLIRNTLPSMELHASTQMTVHNSQGVQFLEQMGFHRAVLAREVSFENIHLVRENSSLELETFVHGALCVAYSGQCLMSSMIGGRSGNRGRCAQPCRMKYALVDSKGQEISKVGEIGEHLLSPKDLKMINHIPELVEAGIVSLKIEGRMKRPEYVATVIRNYRQAIDDYYNSRYQVSGAMEKELEQIFNRGFTTGYYFGNQGKELMSYKRPNNRGLLLGRVTKVDGGYIYINLNEPLVIGDGYEVWVSKGGRAAGEVKEIFYKGKEVSKAYPGQEVSLKIQGKIRVGDRVFKTHDVELMQKAKESFQSSKVERKINLKIKMVIKEGKKILVEAQDAESYAASCEGEFIVERAKKHPINYDTIWKQFSRLGNTPFELVELDCNITDDLMVPISELNKLRREIVESLSVQRKKELANHLPSKKEYMETVNDLISRIPPKFNNFAEPAISVLVSNPNALEKAVDAGADIIYANWEGLKNKKGFSIDTLEQSIQYCHQADKKIFLRLPRFVPEVRLNDLQNLLYRFKRLELDGIMVGNLGTLQLIKNAEMENIYADYTLNIFNDLTLQKLAEYEIMQATLSPELTLEQIENFSYLGNLPLEVIVHGNFPLMVSEYCAVGSIKGERTKERPCKNACAGQQYGLRDRLNLVFPVVMDEYCRMLVYNAKPLSLYKDLNDILNTGIDVIRIEARKESPEWVNTVTKVYRQAVDSWLQNGQFISEEKIIKLLDKLEPKGYTTGHYFRGVL